ncbi:baculoviral IAP repeat-containing protein 3 isoform X2 [Ailuropoda melanoleuca]|uniref:baculoviral IAP repeat-containing protein 3 isoform X2 n=1 Tax=Ailuropoda melanoleuca TaxID=9646 RepID=UPI001494D9E2|nr:baculoviral IAP repeat-containing protein 3 isoform X2 [Ailuropoda melanoleuca]
MNVAQRSQLSSSLPSSTPASELRYDLSCELYRMATFSALPAGVPVSERSLARAGFYYTGVKDKVRCFCCGLMLDNWKPGDRPADKHRTLYPSCAFVRNLSSACVSGASSPPPPPSGANCTHPLPPSLQNTGYFRGSYCSFPSSPVNCRANQECAPWRPSACAGAVRTVADRLLTFQAWPLTSPRAPQLARAGFYYVGPGDRVACFACGGQLSNWEPNDNALSEHLRHFPDCPFVESQLQDALRRTACNLSMQTHAARLKTFCSWPARVPVHPEQLASAGFYYAGHSDDVKCFCCDGGLRCWESGDDPWVEHAKWFPRCEYLIRIKGQEFISQIQASYPHLLEQLLSTSDNTEDENSESPIVHFGPGESSSEDAVMMNTPVVTAALEMGFSRSLVRQTVQSKILTTGENYRTVSDIVSDLLHAEDEIREEEKERAAENRELVQQDIKHLPPENASDLPLEEQLRRLQEERTCKVCMDREVSIVFIPCGHLVVCRDCAPSLRRCPICRAAVKGIVRTFLS